MRKLYLVFLLCSLAGYTLSQDCNVSSAQESISNYFLEANLLNAGDYFWDLSDGAFFISDGRSDGASTMFAASVWLGGYDDGGILKLAAQTYRQSGNDWWPGPLNDQGMLDNTTCFNFDQIWKVSGQDIFEVIDDYDQDDNVDGPVAPSLLIWPAKGNPYFENLAGFPLPDQDLAPFYDRNGDDSYDPFDGDYPVYESDNPNAVPFEMAWSVFNDMGNEHTESGGEKIGTEIQRTMYTLNCDFANHLNYTLFSSFKIINKSDETLNDALFGLWADMDIGCWSDDLIGCVPFQNSFYQYNGTNDDVSCSGIEGFGLNPPVFAYTVLNRPLTSFMTYQNDFSDIGNPHTPLDFYNYMRATWKDGSPVQFGGDGYQENTPPTNFMYPDNPNIAQAGWSEIGENNTPGDRRGVGGVSLGDLLPGQSEIVDVAYSFHRTPGQSGLQNINLMYTQTQAIINSYNLGFSDASCTNDLNCDSDCVYPGDTNADGIVNYLDFLPIGVTYFEFQSPRTPASTAWLPQASNNWNGTLLGNVNYKHSDSNGDGFVDDSDRTLVMDYLGLTNDMFSGESGTDIEGPEINLIQFIPGGGVLSDTLEPFTNTIYRAWLRKPPGETENFYGAGLRVEWDPEVLDITLTIPGGFSLPSVFTNGGDGFHEYSFTYSDGIGNTAPDSIPLFLLFVSPEEEVTEGCSETIRFTGIQVTRPDGSLMPVGNQDKTVYFTSCLPVSVAEPEIIGEQVTIWPNPASQFTTIDWTHDILPRQMDVFDTQGRLIRQISRPVFPLSLNVDDWASGLYLVRFSTEQQIWTEKLVVH